MRDAETTIGNLADKQTVAFIGVADEEGFPIVKAMLAPRKREGIKVFYFTTNTSSRHRSTVRIRRPVSISATGASSGEPC